MGNSSTSAGGMCTFNVDYGMEEALVRGFRSGFITPQQYSALMDYKESTGSRYVNISNQNHHIFIQNKHFKLTFHVFLF